MWWMPSSLMTPRLARVGRGSGGADDLRLEPPHSGEPALVVVAPSPEELAHLRVRQDQEALLAEPLHHLAGHFIGLEHATGRRDHARSDALLPRDLESRPEHDGVHA